jgi:hypothetical protein
MADAPDLDHDDRRPTPTKRPPSSLSALWIIVPIVGFLTAGVLDATDFGGGHGVGVTLLVGAIGLVVVCAMALGGLLLWRRVRRE